MPRHGGMLVCSNHQSHFDPVLVGISFRRRMNYLARKSLFDVPVLSWLIHYLDAIPIERDGMGIGGIKETLRRLKRGESGFYAIAKRSKCPILPVAVAGAYQKWPRDRSFPGIGRVAVSVGDPISAEAIREMSEAELIEELTHRIRDCFAEATQIARIKP